MFLSILPLIMIIGCALNKNAYSEANDLFSCGWAVKSNCDDYITTKWNSKAIGKNLRNWFRSISRISSEDISQPYLRKTLLMFDERNIVSNQKIGTGAQFVGNIDCSSLKHVGPTWRKPSMFSMMQFHDGFLYGTEDIDGELSGENVTFVYPDMQTVLIGKFEKGKMISARPSKIIYERCNNGIKEIQVETPKHSAPVFRYSRPNRLRIGDQPRLVDPFSKKNIFVKTSEKKGDGLFARKDIKKDDLIAYYSGLLWNETEQALYTRDLYQNQTLDEWWDIMRNLMSYSSDQKIHLPGQHWDISNYRATLGHKVNHSFKNFKGIFGKAFHPRFGDIKSVFALADIKKGEEILVHYGYQPGGLVPKWMSDLYFEETGKEWYPDKREKSIL